MTGIYIHIPFCRSKCPYCDFYSFKGEKEQKDGYLKAVLCHLKEYENKVKQVDTVYFGGGTPSVFGGERLRAIIEYIKEHFSLEDAEITVECNPSSVTEELMENLAKAGVNRISMGMQSAVDSERKALGRLSGTLDVKNALRTVKNAGIDNISLDIMLGVPGQTMESLDESLDFLFSADIRHISAYMLKIEEGTPFAKAEKSLALPDEDEVCDMYLHTVKRLSEKGFEQYEVSNFALKGFESRHNLKYWKCEEYIGIGPSAHSFYEGRRFYYERDFQSFVTGAVPTDDGEGGSEEEYIMLALRLKEGLSDKKFRERYGKSLPESISQKAENFSKQGLLTVNDGTVSLTAEGFLVSNYIIGELLSYQ